MKVTAAPIHRIVTRHGRVYDVFWNSGTGQVTMVGLPWSLTDANETVEVGLASSEQDALQACEAAAYSRLSSYSKYVGGATLGKLEVISAHLLVEHILLRCLRKVIPNPAPLLDARTPSFSLLVSLGEAHRVLSADLAGVLRLLNTLRNKCAHRLVFDPSEEDSLQILAALQRIVPPDSDLLQKHSEPLPLLCEVLEQRANELGASDAMTGRGDR